MATTTRIDHDYGGRDFAFFWFCVLLLIPSIWSECSITGQDEYYLSFRTVLEMQDRGEWLTPYVNEQVRLQKPPLLYWLMRISFLVFGSNPFAARIWTVLAAAAMALFTAKLARRQHGSGYLAGLLVVGAAGVAIDARRAMFDLPVGALCTIAVYYSVTWHAHGRLRSAVAAAIALAAATMTKGPVALWFFAAAMLAALLMRRSRAQGPWAHWLVATPVFCLLALPWPIWVQVAHPEFWDVMAEQAKHREFGLPEAKRVPALLGSLLGLIVPWSIAVACGMVAAVRDRTETRSYARWLLLWVAIGMLPFAFMKAFERYLLALVCPMALLATWWLANQKASTLRLHATIATVVIGIPTIVFSLFVAWFGLGYLLPMATLAVWVLCWRVARREQPDVPLCAILTATVLALLLGAIYPLIGINRLPELPAELADQPVVTFGRAQPGMLSIRLDRSVQEMDGRDEGLAARLEAYHGYLFVLDSDVERIEQAAAGRGLPIEKVFEFSSFYSRKAWLKFFRQGAAWPDWSRALGTRSTEPLSPRFVCLRRP